MEPDAKGDPFELLQAGPPEVGGGDARRSPRWTAAEMGLIGVIVLVGLAVRAPQITGWWLYPDEGIYYSIATWADASRAWSEIGSNAHPPLFYLLIRSLARISTGVGFLRLPSLLFGVLVIPAIYLATRELVGRIAGLFAASALALSPSAIVLSQVIRPYTLAMTVGALLLWSLARFIRVPGRAGLAGVGTLLLIAVLLHYGCFVLVAAAGAASGVLLLGDRLAKRDALRLVVVALPAVLAAVLLVIVHVSGHLLGSEMQMNAQDHWLESAFHHDIDGLWRGFAGIFWYGFGTVAGPPCMVLFAVGSIVCIARGELLLPSFSLAAIGLSGALSVAGLYPFAGTRHSVGLLPAIVPCAAAGLAFLVVGRSWRHLAAAVLLGGLALGSGPAQRLLFSGPVLYASPTTMEQVIPWVSAEAARRPLRSALSHGEVILLDRWAYLVLLPFFHQARDDLVRMEEAGLSHFRWRRSDVLVSHHNTLQTGWSGIGTEEHLFRFLQEADAALPELGLAGRHDGRLFVAGSNAGIALRLLLATDRRLDPESVCASEPVVRGGLAWVRLDVAGCIGHLGRPAEPASGRRAGPASGASG